MMTPEIVAGKLAAIAEEFTHHWPVPGGIVVAVTRDGTLFELPFGFADLDARKAVTRDHLFQIGSISKIFVGLMVLLLAEQGKLDLDDNVEKHLPWFRVRSDHPPFTLRHLLNHSSGLPASTDALPDELGQAWWLRDLATGFAPGTAFHYSNIGYILLGLVIASAAGKPAAGFCRDALLDPLGMTATAPDIRNIDRPRYATGYAPAADDRPWLPGDPMAPATWFETNTADGNIAATGPDMGRFLRMVLGAGDLEGRRVISGTSFQDLVGALAPAGEPIVAFLGQAGVESSRYGLGINVETIRRSACYTHGGGMVGYGSFVLADPEADIAIAVLTNANGDCPAAQVIARIGHALLTDADMAVPPISLKLVADDPVAFDPAMIGRFVAAGQESDRPAITVRLDADGAVLLSSGGQTARLFKDWSNRYATDHPFLGRYHLGFHFIEGKPVWTHGPLEFRTSPSPEVSPPSHLKGCTGHFRSHSPWFSNFRIMLRAGRLLLIAAGGVEAPVEEEELVELGPGHFRIGKDPFAPERLVMGPRIAGKVISLERDGTRYSRTFTD